jgi:microtubule-associated protein-like 6
MLSLDEMILAFRSSLSGLAKLCQVDPPTEAEVEWIVVQGFAAVRRAEGKPAAPEGKDAGEWAESAGFDGIETTSFLNFCLNTPEIISWIEYFDDLEEYDLDMKRHERAPVLTSTNVDRERFLDAVMNPTVGGIDRLEYERRGPARDYMPRKNWQNTLPFLAPARMSELPREAPAANLKMEWVYGFNGHTSKQCLAYTAKGSIIYPAGAVIVIQDVLQASQQHFVVHNDLVTCLRVVFTEDGGTMAVSGEAGYRPTIHIWDCEKLRVISSLKGFFNNSIVQVDFSPDREKVVGIAGDRYHCIAVYQWRTGMRLWGARSSMELVRDVRFLSNDIIASCGKRHMFFWKKHYSAGYKRYRGLFGLTSKPDDIWCISKVGDFVVTGGDGGTIHVWEGRNLIRSIKGHAGVVYAMQVVKQGDGIGLVTACSFGKVLVWNSKLEIGASFNANTLGPVEPSVISVCWDVLSNRMLLGFRTCEIFEMDTTDGRNVHTAPVVSAHFNPCVAGLATHHMNPRLFCSVGNDKTVRVFDATSHKLVKMTQLDTMAHCCAYSPAGQLIVVGLGSGRPGAEEKKEGAHVILNEEDLSIIHEARDSKALISDAKFSPSGEVLALASYDGAIYVYSAGTYAAKAKCRGHTGKVSNLDFSHDGVYLMSNCLAGDLLFWDIERAEQQPPKSMKEVFWESNTCIYSYSSQAVYGVFNDGLVCNAVCRSHAQDMIATGDNFGRVRLFNNPCVKDFPCFLEGHGHGANVMNVRFACNDSYIVSSGGTDGCVIQWRLVTNSTFDFQELKVDDANHESLAVELKFEGKAVDRPPKVEEAANDGVTALCLLEEGIEDSNDSLPWQRTIVAPSRVPIDDPSEPPDSLEMEFVRGINIDKSREVLKYCGPETMVFCSGSIGVVMSIKDYKQRFYVEHNSTILSLAVYNEEKIAATGDHGEVPVIRVWSTSSMETVAVMSGFHRRGVEHLTFTKDGSMLISVGLDLHHSIAIYDWRSQVILSHCLSFTAKSLCVSASPIAMSFLHVGDGNIRFYEIDSGNLHFSDALMISRAKLQKYLCIGWMGGQPMVGCADGSIYRFVGRQLDAIVTAHNGCVNAIASTPEGVASVGDDGFLKIWTRTMESKLVIDVRKFFSSSSIIRALDWDYERARIIVATSYSEVYEINAADGENFHKGTVLEGHGGEELWGMDVHPQKELLCTTGDDAILRVWDLQTLKIVHTVQLEMPSRCCAFSSDGMKLAVGFGCPKKLSAKQYDGKWIVLNTEDFESVHEARDSTKYLTEMKYAPNSLVLAIGSFDNKIYIYDVATGYSLTATVTQHNAYITHLDFATDSAWLQSNCAGYELCFFETDTGMFIPAASRLRDVKWASQNCTLGWAVQGIWAPQRDGNEIVSVDCNMFRGDDGVVVACGDKYGRIRLYRYPVQSSAAVSKHYRVGTNPISRIKFANGDSKLISIVAPDRSIVQWCVNRDRGANVMSSLQDRMGGMGATQEDEGDVIQFFGLDEGDSSTPDIAELKAIVITRPWISSMVPPTDLSIVNDSPPAVEIEKRHIFGLQTSNTRASVHVSSSGCYIFPASRYVCVYDKVRNQQTFFEHHTSEISIVTTSKDGVLVASAERCNRPNIMIWDANTCYRIACLQVVHRRGVAAMTFSSNRKMLVSAGMDRQHSVAVWESISSQWNDAVLVAWVKGDVNPILFVGMYEHEGYSFVTGGRYNLKFWTRQGKSVNSSYAEIDSNNKVGIMLCGEAVGKNFVAGAATGHLYVWKGRKLDRLIRAHDMGVSSMWSSSVGFVTGAKDGTIKLWSTSFEPIKSFVLSEADVPPLLANIRSIEGVLSLQRDEVTSIVAATAGGEVYEVAVKSGCISLVMEAHFIGELWGLAPHPTDPELFVTCGDDMTVRVWNLVHRRLVRKAVLDCTAR